MKRAGLALVFAAVVAVAGAACTPIESIDRLDGELGAAKEQRRVLALASPT
ncbi:MAG TPA: hypothetical protein VF334_07115 [Polyangia bacterium]